MGKMGTGELVDTTKTSARVTEAVNTYNHFGDFLCDIPTCKILESIAVFDYVYHVG